LPKLLLEMFATARPLLDFGWAVVDGGQVALTS
jgi:hypothetical protein